MKNNIWLVLLLVSFGLACNLGGQTDEANKLVDEANVLIQQSSELETKSSALFTELLGDNLTKAKDLEAYKKVNKSKFDEVINLTEQNIKLTTEATDKFEQASKLEVDDKFKEYLSVKVQGFRKRIEAEKLVAPICKLFLETKDTDTWNKGIADFNTKNAELIKEAEDLSKKADQISKDNPTIIKD